MAHKKVSTASREDVENVLRNVLVNRTHLMMELKKSGIDIDLKKMKKIMPETWMKVQDVVLAILAY